MRGVCTTVGGRAGIPGWWGGGGYTRVVYSRVCTPLYMPPYQPLVGSLPASLSARRSWCVTNEHELTSRFYTFSHEVGRERGPLRRVVPFFPQNKPPLWPETSLKGPTNPLQKGGLHKDLRNILTPPKVTSNPLKVLARLLTVTKEEGLPPAQPGVSD